MDDRKPSYIMLHQVIENEDFITHYEGEELETGDTLKWDVWVRTELPEGGPDEIEEHGKMFDGYEEALKYANELAEKFNVEVDEY